MKQWFSKNKKILTQVSALTFAALLFFSFIPETQAQGGIVGKAANWVFDKSGLDTLVTQIIMIPLYLATWLSWLGGVLLNGAIQYTIIDLKENLSKITGINIAWSVLRDLANISFIFILLYTAIQTILGQSTGKMKSAILGVVVAAVLINFSLFFTRVAIDTSNILAVTFYAPIENCVEGLPTKDRGMATCLMSSLGLSSTFASGGELLEGVNESFSTAAIVAIGGAIFLTITFFIFTAIAIMLLIRYINFIYLLIISPIGIAGSVIPGLSKQSSEWRQKLISECVFAPAYMLATWVILIVLQGGKIAVDLGATGTNSQKFSGIFTTLDDDGSKITVIINFIIVIGLTLGSLLVAKSLARHSGSAGEKLINGGLKFAGMGVSGTGGFLGRRVGGRIGRNISEREGLKDAAAQGGAKGFAARMALKTSRVAGSGSWDLRSSSVMEKYNQGAKAVGGQALDFGKAGGKGGLDKIVEERSKEKVKFAESLKPSDLTIAKAEQALDEAKNARTEPTDEEYRKEYSRRKRNLEATETKHRKAKEMFDSYQAGVNSGVHTYNPRVFKESKEKMDRAAAELAEAQRKAAVPVSGLREDMQRESQARKDASIARAQGEVDRLKGVSKKEAEERGGGTRPRDSLKTTRMQGYAATQENGGPVSTKRVGFFGKISREQKEIALAIRKKTKGKSAAEEVFEKLKNEVAKDATAGTTPTPPASGPTPPPATPSP